MIVQKGIIFRDGINNPLSADSTRKDRINKPQPPAEQTRLAHL